ncbi:MAG: hypothetical protein E7812_05965 [Phenylobacterium sp.]|nr:MAG: hypothetical protein E7812_05965 [Phenylobacterium sp.]
MSTLHRDPELRSFNSSGYEILGDGIARGEVVIWSVDPVRPRIGDIFLIESGGHAYDAAVEQLTELNGGWSARCRAEPA